MTLYPLSSNNNNPDPYPQYLTQDEADMIYAAEPYAENLAQDAEIAAFNHTNNAIATHITANNPHNITPSSIGAAAALHSHIAADITLGFLPISRGGTGSGSAYTAREALEAAARVHTHKEYPIIPAFYSGWGQYGNPYISSCTKIDKLIILSGVVRRTSGGGTGIMLLDSNLRPAERKLFMCWGALNGVYTAIRIDVETSGIVFVVYPSITNVTVDWISLDGIAFCIA